MGKRLTKVTTSHWGAFAVSVDNGRIVSTKPIDIDPEPILTPTMLPDASSETESREREITTN